MKKISKKGKILTWDMDRGDGLIQIDDRAFDIYACNLPGKKTWYPETACVYYNKGQEVDVVVKYDDYALFVIGVTPPHFDHKKWETLKHKRLAFRCDDDGNATTGLFSLKKKSNK